MKDFYTQKKKKNTKTKESTLKSKGQGPALKRQVDTIPATDDDARASTGTLESGSVQPPSLITHRRRDYEDDIDEVEEILMQFDMNLSYGPCLGVTRLERWERASKLGLNPPKKIKEILESDGGMPDCLWEGHV